MFNRAHAQASPSVSLEKGIARLRPARLARPVRDTGSLKSNRYRGQPRSILPTDTERKSAAILVALAFATLVGVCLALYFLNRSSRWDFLPLLFSTRSELRSPQLALYDDHITPLPPPRVLDLNTRTPVPESGDSSQTYLSYLPHSGFHNQRIALENALIVSYILNRTLLIPPIFLGDPPLPYRPSVNLQVDVALSSKVGLEHCQSISVASYIPEECTNFWTHVHVPWKWLIDFPRLVKKHGLKILMRDDLTDAFLLGLRLQPSETYFLHDTDAYEFRFYDSQSDDKPLGERYKARIDLTTLARLSRGHRLLQFGTLFGTTRIRLTDPTYLALRGDVRRAMVFDNPDLLSIADGVRDSPELGGPWRYAAVHLRLGDGTFAGTEVRAQNVRLVWWKLLRELGLIDKDVAKIELRLWSGRGVVMHPPTQTRDPAASRVPHPPPPPINQSEECSRDALHHLLGIPLFIATDKPNDHTLWIFRHTFPCLYFLRDFEEHVAKLDNLTLASINESPEDASRATIPHQLPFSSLLAPFLDAIIASKARVVIGTPGSTFSRFVEDVLWRAYHDWDIVQRG